MKVKFLHKNMTKHFLKKSVFFFLSWCVTYSKSLVKYDIEVKIFFWFCMYFSLNL